MPHRYSAKDTFSNTLDKLLKARGGDFPACPSEGLKERDAEAMTQFIPPPAVPLLQIFVALVPCRCAGPSVLTLKSRTSSVR